MGLGRSLLGAVGGYCQRTESREGYRVRILPKAIDIQNRCVQDTNSDPGSHISSSGDYMYYHFKP